MPTKEGRLSDEERTRASDRINQTAQHEGDPCPHCGNVDTSVAQDIFKLSVAVFPTSIQYLPIIPVVCNNCGFFRLFHSNAVGVEPYEAPPATPAAEG